MWGIRLFLSGLVSAMLVPPAVAADFPVKAPPAPAGYDWTGFYVGGHVGLATGNSALDARSAGGGAPVAGSFRLFRSPNAFNESGSCFEGVQAGYNSMLQNRVVLGIEADGSFPAFPDPVTGLTIGGISNFSSPSFGTGTFSETVLSSGTLRGRIGYAPGHWLFYATGGLAWSYNQQTLTQIATGNTEDRFLCRFGWAAGVGIEMPIAPNWTVSGEYLWTGFPTASVNFPFGPTGLFRFLAATVPARLSTTALTIRHRRPPSRRRVSCQRPIFSRFTDRRLLSSRPSVVPLALRRNQQPLRRRASERDFRHHALDRRQAMAGCRVLGQSGNRSGLWLQRYPWRRRLH